MMESQDSPNKKEALSPSMITDFFQTKKTGRRQGAKSALRSKKKSAAANSVYLTPESSPGSHLDSESPVKDRIAATNTISEDTVLTSLGEPTATDLEHDTAALVESCTQESHQKQSSDLGHVEDEKLSRPESPLTASTVVKSDSPTLRSPEKCSRWEEGEESRSREGEREECSSPVIHAVRSVESKSASSSPSLPRLKLRKSAKSSSQGEAAVIVKDGEPVKPKPGRRKKKQPEAIQKSVITDFFQVRRSGRQTKSEIEKEKQHHLEQLILSGCEHGLEIKEFENKGRGVVATKDFHRGDFVVEYAGDLIDLAKASAREENYKKTPDVGCYMYYFKCGSKQHCIDATAESGRLGRLLNHSSKDGNCYTRSLEVAGVPRLILVAKRDIKSGEELTYDYGDRSKSSLECHPWLKL